MRVCSDSPLWSGVNAYALLSHWGLRQVLRKPGPADTRCVTNGVSQHAGPRAERLEDCRDPHPLLAAVCPEAKTVPLLSLLLPTQQVPAGPVWGRSAVPGEGTVISPLLKPHTRLAQGPPHPPVDPSLQLAATTTRP